jgi:large subunit ribosomal protein L18
MSAKQKSRERRAKLTRAKIRQQGKHRLVVTRSNANVGIQMISPAGQVVASASSLEKDIKAKLKHCGNVESAVLVGSIMAERIKATGVEDYAFDRSGYKYHGRVKALAEALRDGDVKI